MIKKTIIAGIALLFIGFGYYAISPIFKTITLNEEAPSIENVSEGTNMAVISAKYSVVGTVGHPAEGTVELIDSLDGKIVRYENFKTINGPDLFVYLSKDLEGKEFISLGEIRATEGSVNYTVPSGVDISEYKYVMTWCKQFGVLFNYADISSSPVVDDEKMMKGSAQDDDGIGMPIEKAREDKEVLAPDAVVLKTALFANGCFWCVEHDLEEVAGVIDVVSGYAGGSTENPTYKDYSVNGHREVVLVTYDAQKVTYDNLVEHIIKHGDPTDAGGSFYDRGAEYAPAIYYGTEEEKAVAREVITAVDTLRVFLEPLPLIVIPRVPFWPAEEYHQDYGEKNPLRYSYYRKGSGRDAFIEKYWGEEAGTFTISNGLTSKKSVRETNTKKSWEYFVKPSETELRATLTPLQYEVTQEDGTERPFTNEYDKNYDEGVYVDVVSGEPLFLSKDKYDSGTGWPSFVKPISDDAVILIVDDGLFTTRTEVRSKYADSHLGHVFPDGPSERGGKRYCMNSAALRFISKAEMEGNAYAYLIPQL